MIKLTTATRLRHVLDEAARAFDSVDRRVVLCHGCFDGLHAGHLRHLQHARAQGDVLVVSVTTDAWVRKGPGRPYMTQELRAELVAALEIVDYVILTDGESAADVIRALKPDVFAKGEEYQGPTLDPRTVLELRALAEYGGELQYTPDDVRFSSTVLFADPA